ncbi:hypothetical protein CMI37_25690 [Candidatus Pacearchaeota archaeon]|nr:hypothetical protein [Candidatus Pacearchaeota archaeon]|tara:strand:- start:514 stop:717 length:204 start_codon:yes stop_codon:yes gene_type:complete
MILGKGGAMIELVVIEHDLEATTTEEKRFLFATEEDAASATDLLVWLTRWSGNDGTEYESSCKEVML